MGQFNKRFKEVIAITTDGTAKDAGDVVGGLLTVPVPAGGIIRRMRLVDGSNQAAALTVYIFESAPTSIADDGAFSSAIVVADHKKLIRTVSIAATTDYTVVNSLATAIKADLNIEFWAANGNIYIYLVCTATPTYGASALTLIVEGWAD